MRHALLLGLCSTLLFVAQEQDPGVYVLSNGQTCPLEGATSELPLKSLNRLKNRFTAPAADAVNTQATLAAMIEPPSGAEVSDEHRFDPEQAATITGYVKDWSTDALKHELQGHWITFTGWLLFDFEHSGQAESTSPGNPKNWRATCW